MAQRNLNPVKDWGLVDYDPTKQAQTCHNAAGLIYDFKSDGSLKIESNKDFWARRGNTGRDVFKNKEGLKAWRKDPKTGVKVYYNEEKVDTAKELAEEQKNRAEAANKKGREDSFNDTNRLSGTTVTYRAPDGTNTPPKLTPLTNSPATTNALEKARGTNAPPELKHAADAFQDKKDEANAAVTAANQAVDSVPGRTKLSIVEMAKANADIALRLASGKITKEEAARESLELAKGKLTEVKADPGASQRSVDAAENAVDTMAAKLREATRQLDAANNALTIANEREAKIRLHAEGTRQAQVAALNAAKDMHETAKRLLKEARDLENDLKRYAR
jgi:hypothetical protein